MRFGQRDPAETSAEQDGAGDQPQARLESQPGWQTELTTARPLLPAPLLGTQGGERCIGIRRLACLQLMEVAPDVRAP